MAIIWNTFVVYENLVPNVKKQLIIIGHRSNRNMAQGKAKLKNKLPSGVKAKNKKQNKPLGLKKGGMKINF